MSLAVRRYRVAGRVQGVGFRWYVRERARALRLKGWVRNESDGVVTVLVSGDANVLDAFEAALHDGPQGAVVKSVERQDLTAFDGAGLTAPFQITR